MTLIYNALSGIGMAIVVTACAPVSNVVSLPEAEVPTNLSAVEASAKVLIHEAAKGAKHSGRAAQITELPILGAAITAASLAGFGAHPEGVLVSSIVGGSGSALSSYYKPRETALAYLDAADAARCIQIWQTAHSGYTATIRLRKPDRTWQIPPRFPLIEKT
ncbi:MAG: hypothetical protein AAGH68_11510 [Pseudomonadota bacterium]